MEERTDQEWTRLLKQDDPQAIHDLWKSLFMYGTIAESRYCPTDEVGRDAAVEAYRRIMTRGIYQFRYEGSFLGFCRVIVIHELLRLLRKRGRQLQTEELIEDLHGEIDKRLPTDPRQVRERLQPCLDQLTPREREVIDLRYFKDHDPAATADLLGITRNYVNVIAHRARLKLQDCLKDQGYLSPADLL